MSFECKVLSQCKGSSNANSGEESTAGHECSSEVSLKLSDQTSLRGPQDDRYVFANDRVIYDFKKVSIMKAFDSKLDKNVVFKVFHKD